MNRKKFISFSGGVESTTMCLLYGADAKAIFADTGWEHKLMYERLAIVEEKIKAIHPNFEIIRVQNEKGTLQDYILDQKFYMSFRARFCTRMFKIEPIDKFLKDQGNCELMIGLNADEGERVGNLEKMKNVFYTYPLLKNDITREQCIELLKEHDLVPRLPVYMRRGGCVGCFFKSKKEFKAMFHLSPSEFMEVENIEKALQDERKEFYSIRDGIESFEKLRKEEANSMFSSDEMYELFLRADEISSCGAFCHR